MKTNWAMLAALVAAGVVGCGGDGHDGGSATAPATPAGGIPEGTTVTFALMETTDLHSNVLGYNYYALAEDTSLAWTARPP